MTEGRTLVHNKAGKVQADDLIVINACCCEIDSCFCKFPDCCGCYINSTCCCCSQEGMCCKQSNVEGECCIISQTTQTCIMPSTCCKGVQQCYCYDIRCGFPCDRDVPCVLALCFVVCCYNNECICGCCKSLKNFSHEDEDALIKDGVRSTDKSSSKQAPQSKEAHHEISLADQYPTGEFDQPYSAPQVAPEISASQGQVEHSPYAARGSIKINPMGGTTPLHTESTQSLAQSPMQLAMRRPSNPLGPNAAPGGGGPRRASFMPPGQIAPPM